MALLAICAGFQACSDDDDDDATSEATSSELAEEVSIIGQAAADVLPGTYTGSIHFTTPFGTTGTDFTSQTIVITAADDDTYSLKYSGDCGLCVATLSDVVSDDAGISFVGSGTFDYASTMGSYADLTCSLTGTKTTTRDLAITITITYGDYTFTAAFTQD